MYEIRVYLWLSSFFHQTHKSLKVMLGVVWTRCGFGMVLDRDHRQRPVAHSFDTLVVEIDVSDLNFRRQTLSTHRETMIVRRDLNVWMRQLFHGLVAAAMTKD